MTICDGDAKVERTRNNKQMSPSLLSSDKMMLNSCDVVMRSVIEVNATLRPKSSNVVGERNLEK